MPFQGDNMTVVKRTNRSAALRLLHEQGSLSRKKLSESTSLTPAAITKIVGELIGEGLVREGRTIPGDGAGRREVLLELESRARCALGLLINRRQALLSAVWLDGEVIFSEHVSLPENAPADETLDTLCARLTALAAEHHLGREKTLGVGVAIRGLTGADGRTLRNSYGALDEEEYPVCAKVEALTGLPAIMANNVRALLLAQLFFSRDREMSSQFFLRCEYGIGAALTINDRLWLGGTCQCAEIGHIPVVLRGGRPCSCGKSGCLETIASPTAILTMTREIFSPEKTPVLYRKLGGKPDEELDIQTVLNAARSGDEGVGAIVDKAVAGLSTALRAVIYIVDPEKIVLYGRLFDNSYFLARLMAEMREGVDPGHNVVVEKSRFNGRLEAPAAPLLVIQHFFETGGMKQG